jgi:hypothetical protein
MSKTTTTTDKNHSMTDKNYNTRESPKNEDYSMKDEYYNKKDEGYMIEEEIKSRSNMLVLAVHQHGEVVQPFLHLKQQWEYD